jgi:hypothetical protein
MPAPKSIGRHILEVLGSEPGKWFTVTEIVKATSSQYPGETRPKWVVVRDRLDYVKNVQVERSTEGGVKAALIESS